MTVTAPYDLRVHHLGLIVLVVVGCLTDPPRYSGEASHDGGATKRDADGNPGTTDSAASTDQDSSDSLIPINGDATIDALPVSDGIARSDSETSSHELRVVVEGKGSVTSDVGDIRCPGACTGRFAAGSKVTLTATATQPDVFAGWAAPCSGTGTCAVTMEDDKTVTARFVGPGGTIWQVPSAGWNDGVLLDAAGNIVVAGRWFPQNDAGDLALAKFAPDGQQMWRKSFGGPALQWVGDMAIGPDGTIVITGGFEGTTDFGGVSKTVAGESDVFVAAYSSEGQFKSVITFGGAGSEGGLDVVIDRPSGDWIVTGFAGQFLAGSTMLMDDFLLRTKPDGRVLWAREAGRSSVRFTPDGAAIFAVGDTASRQISRHLPGDGTPSWSRSLGARVDAMDVHVDPSGTLFVTGGFESFTSAAGSTVTSHGERDIFVFAIAADTGNPLWSERVAGSQGDELASAICADSTGNVYVTGHYTGGDKFIPGEPKAGFRAFIAKYSRTGTKQWIRTLPSTSAASMLCDVGGGVIVGATGYLMKLAP